VSSIIGGRLGLGQTASHTDSSWHNVTAVRQRQSVPAYKWTKASGRRSEAKILTRDEARLDRGECRQAAAQTLTMFFGL